MLKLNGVEICPTIFSDNTSQIWKIHESLFETASEIEWIFGGDQEVFHLFQLAILCRSKGVKSLNLLTKYLPYARQDKPISNESTFALHVFSKIINQINFDSIFCYDPHSDIAKKLINNLFCIDVGSHVYRFFTENNYDVVLYPDLGAKTRYSELYGLPYIYADKKRDQLTGNIEGLDVIGDCDGKTVLIVDDICDGGGTFIIAAKELYDKGAIDVGLFVSHGIFSKGKEVLYNAGINKVFSLNNLGDKNA
jgi:ribose-phosphate pyrophosphokinase